MGSLRTDKGRPKTELRRAYRWQKTVKQNDSSSRWPATSTRPSLFAGASCFEVREHASCELGKLEDLAEPALQRALDSKPSPEVAWRVQKLLDNLDSPTLTVRQLRLQRSVEILERAGSIEARHALSVLAREAPGHWLRDQARTALRRLENETAPRP